MQNNMHCDNDDEYQSRPLMNLNQKVSYGNQEATPQCISLGQDQPIYQACHAQ
jgi:hypothetical protein